MPLPLLGIGAGIAGAAGLYGLGHYLRGPEREAERAKADRAFKERRAAKRAQGMLAESEAVRQDLRDLPRKYLGQAPELMKILQYINSIGLPGDELEGMDDPARVAAALDAQSGVPGLGQRIAQATQAPRDYMALSLRA